MDRISKTGLETMLGSSITDTMFKKALGCARQKQEYIYQREKKGGGFAGLVSAGTNEGAHKKHCTFKIHIGVMW